MSEINHNPSKCNYSGLELKKSTTENSVFTCLLTIAVYYVYVTVTFPEVVNMHRNCFKGCGSFFFYNYQEIF